MVGELVAVGATADWPRSAAAREPFGGAPPLPLTLAAVVVLVLVVMVGAVLRVIPRHERLVVWRLGGDPVVKGPGPVLVLPGIERWERVDLRPDPLEMWLRTVTRDGVTLRLRAIALLSVIDPARYAARAATFAAGAIVEGHVRRYATARDLAQLSQLIAEAGSLTVEIDAVGEWALQEWGLAAPMIRIVQADVPLHGLRRWAAGAPAAVTTGSPVRA